MNTDITMLDALDETDPVALADLADQGLRACSWTCWFWTCLSTCAVTEG